MKDREGLVRRYYELVDAGDLEAMYELFHDRIVYRRPGYAPIEGKRFFRDFYEAFRVIADGRHEVENLVIEGERVAVQGSFEGTLKDGSRTSLRFADFFVFHDMTIIRRDTYFDAPLI